MPLSHKTWVTVHQWLSIAFIVFAYDAATADLSLEDYVAAVSRSSLGTNNPVYTRQTAEHSLARVNELRKWGFLIRLSITNVSVSH